MKTGINDPSPGLQSLKRLYNWLLCNYCQQEFYKPFNSGSKYSFVNNHFQILINNTFFKQV